MRSFRFHGKQHIASLLAASLLVSVPVSGMPAIPAKAAGGLWDNAESIPQTDPKSTANGQAGGAQDPGGTEDSETTGTANAAENAVTASTIEESDGAASGMDGEMTGAAGETDITDGAGSDASTGETGVDSTGVAATQMLEAPDQVIPDGITINGAAVGGMTEQEALAAVEDGLTAFESAQITLTGQEEGQSVTVSAGELGMKPGTDLISAVNRAGSYGHGENPIARYKARKDLEEEGAAITAEPDFDIDTMTSVVTDKCSVFNREAQDASLHRENGTFVITGGQSGVVVDVDKSVQKIYETLKGGLFTGGAVTIPLEVKVDEPKGDPETLAKVGDVLGTFTTSYATSNSNRAKNIANGCRLINGRTLYPGDQLSVLECITPFTEENGYELAGSYLGSQVVESFGGGICQVSTTLYNAVIRAELTINERYNHSLIVGYVDPSDDAAIAESSGMDMVFTNSLDYPVYIDGYTSGGQITFTVYGVETRDPGRKVTFESETIETIDPTGEAVYTDATKPAGTISYTSAHQGIKARLWKVVTQNGEQVSREVFNNSTYNAAPRACTVGTLGGISDALQAAINAQSIEQVEAVINAGGAAAGSDAGAGAAADPALQQQAAAAADAAFAAAIAAGKDEQTAMAEAQAAAEAVANGG